MVEHTSLNSAAAVLTNLGKLLPDLESLYKDIHAHPGNYILDGTVVKR